MLYFAISKHLELVSQNRDWIRATLDFAWEIKDFDNMVDPHHLYDHCLRLEPTEYMLKKIHQKEKSMCILWNFLCCTSSLSECLLLSSVWEMATRYSNEKYARIKGMKNEPLSQLATNPKKQKLNEEKGETFISSSVHTIPSSLTLSLEVMVVTPPTTRSKGKSKIGKSV